MLRVPYSELNAVLERAMLQLGLTSGRAALCARLFAETTRDGVYTHGLNRFSRFATMVHNGSMNVDATPERVSGTAVLERWDGHLGPGNLAAHAAMSRAVALAKQNGLGAVALARTTHWMRGGTYGWLAAHSGVFGLCFTNTMPNLPPWGATSAALGNNPLILAIPRSSGAHVVLDMAISQFSYGTLAGYSKRDSPLPFDGGFDSGGNLTRDAAAIEASQRALPIGYWKGSGLSIALDLMATMFSAGLATHQISTDPMRESASHSSSSPSTPRCSAPTKPASMPPPMPSSPAFTTQLQSIQPNQPAIPAKRRSAFARKTCGSASPSIPMSGNKSIATIQRHETWSSPEPAGFAS